MDENPLDLIYVRFDDEVIQARPFEFHEDEDGNLLCPTKASTSCPFCGHGNEIDLTEWMPGTIFSVKCSNCGAGNESFVELNDHIDSNSSTVTVDRYPNDIEKEIMSALNDDSPVVDKSIKVKSSNNITIDTSDDVHTLKSGCPFIDPIELGTFVIDEI